MRRTWILLVVVTVASGMISGQVVRQRPNAGHDVNRPAPGQYSNRATPRSFAVYRIHGVKYLVDSNWIIWAQYPSSGAWYAYGVLVSVPEGVFAVDQNNTWYPMEYDPSEEVQ
jgi:hypothetical protein